MIGFDDDLLPALTEISENLDLYLSEGLDPENLGVGPKGVGDPPGAGLEEREARFLSEHLGLAPDSDLIPRPPPLLINILTNDDEYLVCRRLQQNHPGSDAQWHARAILDPNESLEVDEESGVVLCCVRQQSEASLCGRAEAHQTRLMSQIWVSSLIRPEPMAVPDRDVPGLWRRRIASELVTLSLEFLLSRGRADPLSRGDSPLSRGESPDPPLLSEESVAQIVTRADKAAGQLLINHDDYLKIFNKLELAFTIRQIFVLARLHLAKRARVAVQTSPGTSGPSGVGSVEEEVMGVMEMLPRIREVSELLRGIRAPVPLILPAAGEASPSLIVPDSQNVYTAAETRVLTDFERGMYGVPPQTASHPEYLSDAVTLARMGALRPRKRIAGGSGASSVHTFLRRLRTPCNDAAAKRVLRARKLVETLQPEVQREAPEGFGPHAAALEELCLEVERCSVEDAGAPTSFRPSTAPDRDALPLRAVALAQKVHATPRWLETTAPPLATYNC